MDTGYSAGSSVPVTHTWGDWLTIVEADGCKPGLKARECSTCGETEVKIIHAAHNYVTVAAQEPTCLQHGWYEYRYCTECGDNNYQEIPPLEHCMETVIVNATCLEDGCMTEWCTNCGMIFEETAIPALGHSSDGDKCIRCGLKHCHINIKYLYSDLSEAFDEVRISVWAGETYAVVSPELEGYIADMLTVSGIASDNMEFVVTYNAIALQHIVRIEAIPALRVAYNTPISSLPLPSTVIGYTSTNHAITLSVYWNHSTYSPTSYGTQYVTGLAVAGYGYAIECSNEVVAEVTVASNIITSINSMDLGKLPLNTSYAGLGLPSTAAVTTSTGAIYYLPVSWNAYEYDASVIGQHRISGSVTLAEGFSFAEGVDNVAYITFELSERMYGTADIVFLIDTTGSMGGEIQNVKNNIVRFAENLEREGVSVRWALLEYRDITVDGSASTRVIYCGGSEWYIDVNSYRQAISRLNVSGGGDCAETVIDALAAAMLLDSREDATTFYIVVTDADYKEQNNYGISGMNEMINQLVAADTVTSVVTKTSYYSVYRNLTDRTNGILANIDGDFAAELWRLCDLIAEQVVYGEVTGIEIVTQPEKTAYFSGDYFDGSGMVVRAHYESGRSRVVSGYSVYPYGALQVSDTFIEINYRGKTVTLPISVVAPEISVGSVEASVDRLNLLVGESRAVTATVYPTGAINSAVIWTTANPNVAVVDAHGVITAIGIGETVITVITLDGGFTDEITVTVEPVPVPVNGIYTNIGAAELLIGETIQVTANVLPGDATNQAVAWTTSNAAVASVENGLITANGEGTATITVTTLDGGYTSRIYIRVGSISSTVSGRVYDASTSSALSGVTVEIYNGGTLIDRCETGSNGSYSFASLTFGVYTIRYTKSGYISTEYVCRADMANVQIDNTYLALDSSLLPGCACGYAQDATTVSGIEGITIYIRSGMGNVVGSYLYSITTDNTGYYITPALEPGNYTLQFVDNREVARQYTTASLNIAISGNTVSPNNNVSLSAPLSSNTMSIVLEWGATPRDLDSHLLVQRESGSVSHVHYAQKAPSGANASLDVDDTTSYGPETITVTIMENTVYHYYVHNYSGGTSGLMNSGAKVTVHIGSKTYAFYVPTVSGLYWDLFTYNSATGELIVHNQVVSSAPTT